MAVFRYKALTHAGELRFGEIEATDALDAISRVQDEGYIPISTSEFGQSIQLLSRLPRLFGERGPTQRDVGLLTQQLAALIGAGLTTDRALEVLAPSTNETRIRPLIKDLVRQIRSGTALSDALVPHERVFPSFYVNTIRAAERGGFLSVALHRLADFMLKSQALRDTVRSALIYPMLLLIMATVSIVLILIVVLPQFRPLFADAGTKLSFSASAIMAISGVFENYWPIFVIVTLTLYLVLQHVIKEPKVIDWFDSISLKIPVLREVIAQFEVGRFVQTLGLLVENGVTLPSAMELAGCIVRNRQISAIINRALTAVKEGERLAQSLDYPPFPGPAIALIRVGEETGQLPKLLMQVADILQRDVQRTLDRMMALLVPVLTIVLGLIVATIIASILSALISVNDLVT